MIMPNPTIHLVVVTGQAQANLIPIMQLKPTMVALAVSAAMQENAKEFAKLLKTVAGYDDSSLIHFGQVPDAGLEDIRMRALEIEEELETRFPGSPITYHATGGTKLMALAFYEVFRGHTVLYTDSEHGQIEVLYPEKQAPFAIDNVLTIQSYLLSMGKQFRKSAGEEWRAAARDRKALSKWFAHHAERLEDFWGVINTLANDALAPARRGDAPGIARPLQTFRNVPRGLWAEALAKINEAGICRWDSERPETVYFDSAAGALYLGGAWLEEFVWLTAQDLGATEALANVEFTELGAPKDDIRNEMDCMLVHSNRLLMVECKTSVFKDENQKNANILYKLESLGHRAGGLYGEKWLVSARPLDSDTLKRAKEYKINVLSGGAIKKLGDKMRLWMEGKK
jgi:hypothetical protein